MSPFGYHSDELDLSKRIIMSKMPEQKPGRSEQVVCTPEDFLGSLRMRLAIPEWSWDLAADHSNKVCDSCYTEADDALIQRWNMVDGWNWCNPPYGDIEPWVAKARFESLKGANTAMLVPASVGSNWWAQFVHNHAYVLFARPRLTFKGHNTPYPKDLAVLLYNAMGAKGYDTWNWKED